MNVLVTAQGRTDWLDPLRWGILSRVARRPGERVAQVLRGDSVVEERALRELADAGWLSIRNETLEQPLAGPNVRLTPVGEEAVASGLAWIRSIGTPKGTPGTADPRIRPELLRKRARTRGNRAAGQYTAVVKDTGGTLRFAYQGPSLATAQSKARAAAAMWGLPAIVVDDRWNEVATYDPPGGDDAPTVRDRANRARPIDPRIAEAAARFPETFGLRWYAGSAFRVSPESSYVMTDARGDEEVVLYTQRRMPDGAWLDFAKGSPEELAREVVQIEDEGNRAGKKGDLQIVLAWLSDERRMVRERRTDLGELPVFEDYVLPHSAMWMNRGTEEDLQKAVDYAGRQSHRHAVYAYPRSEGDPLGRARAEIMGVKGYLDGSGQPKGAPRRGR